MKQVDENQLVGPYNIRAGDLLTLNPGNELAVNVMKCFLIVFARLYPEVEIHKILDRDHWQCLIEHDPINYYAFEEGREKKYDKLIYPYNVDGNYLWFLADLKPHILYLFDSSGLFNDFEDKNILLNSVNRIADGIDPYIEDYEFFKVEIPKHTNIVESGVHMCIQIHSIIQRKCICETATIENEGRLYILSTLLESFIIQ